MKKFNIVLYLIIFLGISIGLTGCKKSDNSVAKKNVTLNISAAASLKDSMEEIKKLYGAKNPNVNISYNFASSGTLQQQIEQGSPTDIFISAAPTQMNALKTKGIMEDDTIKNLLKNEIVLIVPGKSTNNIKDFKDLAGSNVKKIALGEVKSVPAGQYAKEVLSYFNILDKVQAKNVYAKDVREVLSWVETGNVDAGIVYATDAKTSNKVKVVVAAPEGSHKNVFYPVGVVKSSKNIQAAKEFIQFMSSEEAKSVFKKYGFESLK